ncbi:MAG: Sec-independent protein translocase subunit TatA/TatB [Kiritimatiellia bacterium]
MIDTLPLSFLSASVGPLELLLVLSVALVLFGPKRLPEASRKLGLVLNRLRQAMDEFKEQLRVLEEEVPPEKNPEIRRSEIPEEASDERSSDSRSAD